VLELWLRSCGYEDDRDVNAAKNVLKSVLAEVSRKGTGGAVRWTTPNYRRWGQRPEGRSSVRRGGVVLGRQNAYICSRSIIPGRPMELVTRWQPLMVGSGF